VSTRTLAAVCCTGRKTGVAFAADLLVAVVLGGEDLQGRLDDPTAQTENKMESGFLLDVVVAQSTAILQLFTSKDKTLLIWGNPFLVLDLRLDIVNSIRGLDLKGDGLARECLDEDLHAASKAQDEMEGRLFLDVVIRKSTPILELLPGEDQTLLVRRNAFLILDLGLNIIDGVGGFDLKSDGLSCECLVVCRVV